MSIALPTSFSIRLPLGRVTCRDDAVVDRQAVGVSIALPASFSIRLPLGRVTCRDDVVVAKPLV